MTIVERRMPLVALAGLAGLTVRRHVDYGRVRSAICRAC